MDIKKRIKEVMDQEAAAIQAVKVTPEFEDAVHALHNSAGKVLTTGMGKAGFIARKFAATLCSTGTPASVSRRSTSGPSRASCIPAGA